MAGLTGMVFSGGDMIEGLAAPKGNFPTSQQPFQNNNTTSVIGLYGAWANSLNANQLPALSFRRNSWKNIVTWKKAATSRALERLAIPDIGPLPGVTIKKQYSFDGLHIEELTWQLPYGRPTEALLLKPLNAKGKLPAVLGFHDHG